MKESAPEQSAQVRFERLQQLLLESDRAVSDELQAEIVRLRAELVSPEEIHARISPFLEERLRYMQSHFPELFGPVLSTTIKRQIEESQDEMVDALYPIMGKMIRKFVSKEVERLSQRIDQQVNDMFSWKAWMRRFRGWMKGESEQDRRVQDLVRASVEEVYIIDKLSGLLAGSWSRAELLDRDMVAGMLTAIKAFVEHAFSKGEQELEMIEYEDYKILLHNFPSYYIAVVVSGTVNTDYKLLVTDMLLQFASSHKVQTRDPLTEDVVNLNSKALKAHLATVIDENQ